MTWTAALLALMGSVRDDARENTQRQNCISRIDVDMLNDDRRRDLGLIDGRRLRGERRDTRGMWSAR